MTRATTERRDSKTDTTGTATGAPGGALPTVTLAMVTLPSPVGVLRAYASDRGVRALLFPNASALRGPARSGVAHPVLAMLRAQLAEYFAGARRAFDVPLDPLGTEFQLAAWRALCAIPYGTTRSYREQAAAIGRPKATRAVGAANGRNPIPIVVPCHRVIGADGSLTGFGGGIAIKQALLELEARSVAGAAAR